MNLFYLKNILVILLIAGMSSFSNGQCTTSSNITTTYSHNNGHNGIMFDLVAINNILITCFDMNFNPGTLDYEVYFKIGTAQGFQTNAGSWTLIGNGAGITSAGNGNPTPINLNQSVGICTGNRVAFYITNTGSGSANANYTNGTSINNIFVADANIEVREMYGKGYPFSSSFSPRVFNGTIYYNTGSCLPVPIELTDFQALEKEDRWVDLIWQTASEINNDYFTIERSKDGLDWNELNTIKGSGNSSSILNYNTTDYSPLYGISYYRLKQTDFDGKPEYSKIRSVNLEMTDNLEMYPNPTNNQITIVGSSNELEKVTIYNSLGQDVTLLTQQSEINETKVVIDLLKLI